MSAPRSNEDHDQIAYGLNPFPDDRWRSECFHYQCSASWITDNAEDAEGKMERHIRRVHHAEPIGVSPFKSSLRSSEDRAEDS